MQVDTLYKLLGDPGRYHIIMYLLLNSNWWPVNHNHLIMAFYGATPTHHCAIPGGMYLNNSIPQVTATNGVLRYDSCNVYKNFSMMENETVPCPMGYEYDMDSGENTIVTEWDLVCESSYLKNLATTIYFVGVMIGGILFGALADRLGRRPIVLFTLLAPVPLGVGLFFVHDYILFVSIRFLIGMILQGLQTTSYVLLLEMVQPKHRTICGTSATIFWAFGNMWIAFVSYLLKDWHYIQLVICLPSALMIFQIWVIPESPRWLVANKKFDEVKQFFIKAGKFNKIQFQEDAFETQQLKVDEKQDDNAIFVKERSRTYTVLDLFKTPRLRKRSLIAFFIWFSMSLGYYGLSFSLTSLAGNKYLNFFIGGFLELAAYILATIILMRFGRPRPLTFYLIIAAVFCIVAGCIPHETANGTNIRLLSTVFALAGRFSIASCFSVMFLYTSELFPTVIRNLGVGSCAFFTRFGGVMAPLILQMGQRTFKELPIIIFGCFALVGGFLAFLLPETLGQHLPDTIEEAESCYDRDTFGKKRQELMVSNQEKEGDETSV